MGLFNNSQDDIPTQFNGIRTNSAILGTTLPILVGQQRINSWKLLWYGAFNSWQASEGGSGLIKGGSSYVYSASVLGAVCMGPCANMLGVWSSNGKFAIITSSETYVVSGSYAYIPTNANFFVQDLGAGVTGSYSVTVNDYGSPGNVTYSGTQQVPLTYVTGTPGPGQYSITNNPSIGPFVLTSVNGSGVFLGTVVNGDSNAYEGLSFTITGFTNSQNNVVSVQCTGSSATSISLAVVTIPETHSGLASAVTPQYNFNAAQAGETVVVNYITYRYHIDENELDVIPISPTAPVIVTQYQPYFGGDTGVFYYPSGIALTDVTPATPSAAGEYNYAYSGQGGIYEFYNGTGGDGGQGVVITYIYDDPNYDPNDPTGKLNLTFYGGGLGQTPWPYLTSTFPGAALGYSEIAYVASSGLYLGYTPNLPQMNFEILGPYSFGNGIPDACPADVIYGLLTSPEYKYNFPAQNIHQSLLEGNSSAKAQWIANNYFISAVMDSSTSLMDTLSDWCEAGQVYNTWDEGVWKFIPLVDTTTVDNGVTYYPPTQPIIDLDDNDFVTGDNEDPITIEQNPWQNRWNRVSVRWSVRTNDYNSDLLQIQDEASVQQYGLMEEDAQSYDFICLEDAAQFAANMRLQRFSAIYTTYSFTLKSNFAFLSPGDVITVTDGLLGTTGTMFGRTPVRLTKMTDDPNKGIICEAENYPWSVGAAYLLNKQAQIPSNTNDGPQEDPGNATAIIFEVPNQAAQFTGDQVYIFVNGSNVNWGGFQMWVSLDGITYRYYNQYTTEGKIGITTSDYPLHADPDTTDTLSVNMEQSGAVLQSTSTTAWNYGNPPGSGSPTLSALVSPGQSFEEDETAGMGTAVGSPGGTGTTESQGPQVVNASEDVTAGLGLPWTNPNGVTGSSSYASINMTVNPTTLPAGVYLQGSVTAYFYNSITYPQGAIRQFYPISTTPGASLGNGVYCVGSATGNSLMFNTPPSNYGGSGDPDTHPIQWATINNSGTVTGFTTPYLGDQGQSFFTCLVGQFYIPVAGTYSITISHDDGLIWAISGGASIVSASDPGNGSQSVPDDPFSHTETLVMGYSFPSYSGGIPNPTTVGGINGQGFHPENYTIHFPSAGTYSFEIDWQQLQGPQVLGVYTGATSGSPWSASTILPASANQNFSDYLLALNPEFTVPTGANSIIGLEMSALTYCSASSISNVPNISAALTYNGAQLGLPIQLINTSYPTSPTTLTAGNTGALTEWNILIGALTPTVVNSASFGIQLQASISGTVGQTSTLYIKDVQVEIVWETAGSVIAWSNPQNVSSSSSYASATLSASQNLTQWLYATNFGFQLPFGFILSGIQVNMNAYTSSSVGNLSVIMTSEEQRIGGQKSQVITTTPTNYTFGSNVDNWGAPSGYWDIQTLNAQGLQGFGVMMQVQGAYSSTVYINDVVVTLYGTSSTNLELVAFETATLTGQNTYALTTMHRGLLGTFPCDHPAGSIFAQLNEATIIYEVPAQYLGSTIYFKFLSFNAYGYQLQSLANVTAYAVFIQGLSPGAIDQATGALLTGTQNFGVTSIEAVIAANHGPFGIQNIPSGYALIGPTGQLSGIPQWQNVTTGAGGGIADIYLYIPPVAGTYGPSQELYYTQPVRNIVFPQFLVGCAAGCRVAPTANCAVELLQDGVSIGTVNFTAGLTTTTFTFANAISFNGFSDTFQVLAPATVDATFAGFWMALQIARLN
jgi:hypothetical protein